MGNSMPRIIPIQIAAYPIYLRWTSLLQNAVQNLLHLLGLALLALEFPSQKLRRHRLGKHNPTCSGDSCAVQFKTQRMTTGNKPRWRSSDDNEFLRDWVTLISWADSNFHRLQQCSEQWAWKLRQNKMSSISNEMMIKIIVGKAGFLSNLSVARREPEPSTRPPNLKRDYVHLISIAIAICEKIDKFASYFKSNGLWDSFYFSVCNSLRPNKIISYFSEQNLLMILRPNFVVKQNFNKLLKIIVCVEYY